MVYRKGEITKKRKLADWPFHVRTPIPAPRGLGQRLNEMHHFCMHHGLDYANVSERGTGSGTEAAIWCFKEESAANAFRARFVADCAP